MVSSFPMSGGPASMTGDFATSPKTEVYHILPTSTHWNQEAVARNGKTSCSPSGVSRTSFFWLLPRFSAARVDNKQVVPQAASRTWGSEPADVPPGPRWIRVPSSAPSLNLMDSAPERKDLLRSALELVQALVLGTGPNQSPSEIPDPKPYHNYCIPMT